MKAASHQLLLDVLVDVKGRHVVESDAAWLATVPGARCDQCITLRNCRPQEACCSITDSSNPCPWMSIPPRDRQRSWRSE